MSENDHCSRSGWEENPWCPITGFLVLVWCVDHLFLVPYRWGIPQLSSLFPLRLCYQRVWLQDEPYHLLHRPDVLPGPGQGPQESVPRDGPGPNTAHRRRKPPEWLSLLELWSASRQNNRKEEASQSFDSSTFSHPLRIKVSFMRASTTFCLFLWFL